MKSDSLNDTPHPSDRVKEKLETLRQSIDAIDEKIVSLIAERQQVVDRVVSLKKKNNLPVYHPAREEDLISMRRHQGREIGVDPDYVEELYRIIIHRSRLEQTRVMAEKGVCQDGKILIIGGKGGMGRYFHECFSQAGYDVRIIDKDNWEDFGWLSAGVDLVMVCVPIDVTGEVIQRIGPSLPAGAVLCDITSIKEKPLEEMMNAYPGPVIGLHPLFGPSTSSLNKQIIVATPGRNDAACQWLLDQFIIWGSIIIRSDAREHDEIMGIVQSLRHFATFTFGRFMEKKHISLSKTLEFSSPIYRLEIGMVGRLFAQDPSLYSEIIFASPQRRALLKEYIASLNETVSMLENGDKDFFQSEFLKIADWFGPFSEQAMRESTFLIDKLIERF